MIKPEEILKKYWGYEGFRSLQKEIIENILSNNDTLALLPTGGGKSICFQVPGLILQGVTLVITPLIALMKDQVDQLKQRGISAQYIHSGLSYREIDIILENCTHNLYKFLYVSPERLQTEIFKERLSRINVSLVAIDEAHCISKWGHDFRPSYLRISALRELKPEVTFAAFTATATPKVQNDIYQFLELKDAEIFSKSFARDNLRLASLLTEQKETRLLQILHKYEGSSIVYVKTRKRTQEVCAFLVRQGVSALFYHAGLNSEERSERQSQWIKNEKRVVVSTNAFGMGIDKPDVRNVIHLDVTDNLEAYYQEAGRAGRDGEIANAFLLYNPNDLSDGYRWLELRHPSIDEIKRVYQCLCNYFQLAIGDATFKTYTFDLKTFAHTFGLNTTKTHFCLKVLEENELIKLNEAYHSPSRVRFKVNNKGLYAFQLNNKKVGSFTKTILRVYGGELFSGFQHISEKELANAHQIPRNMVVDYLNRLHKQEIIEYLEQQNAASVTFLNNRQDAKYLLIDEKKYEERKKSNEVSFKSMLAYTTENRLCRMAMFQEYFGEKSPQRCGQCDNCVNLQKLDINQETFNQLSEQVEHILPAALSKICSQLSTIEPQMIEKIVLKKVDDGSWKYDGMGILFKN